MKRIVVIVLLSAFVVGCVSLRSSNSEGCQGRFTPINVGKH